MAAETLGAPSSDQESVIEKLDERSRVAISVVPDESRGETTQEQAFKSFDMDVALRSAMRSPELTLVLPEYDLEIFPPSIGDTLFLQTSFLRGICLPHNKISSILNPMLPQVSLYHLRYVKELNLLGNGITFLPGDVGAMFSLETLNLAHNRLSSLPLTMTRLTKLRALDISNNNFSTLMDEFALMEGLEQLELGGNLFVEMPPPIVKMAKIKNINMMRNVVPHLAVQTTLHKSEALWWPFTDDLTAEKFFVNVLTKEKVKNPSLYNGKGIERAKDLHVFQRKGTTSYRRRKFWLSICQVHEWDDIVDLDSGRTFYRNNVSGVTTWDIPPVLDSFGEPQTLETVNLACNAVRFLSDGMCKLIHLRIFIAHTNKLKDLPDPFGDLVNLEILDLHNNDIRLLPRSFCGCTNLVSLNVSGNQLLRLPDLLGTLPRLKKVEAAGNRMSSIPFSIGYSTTIDDLKVMENPLTDPSQDEVSKGLESLKWYLRQRLMIDNRGMPPVMEYHKMSIMHEITVLKPEFNAMINDECRVAAKSGFLNLQLMGLEAIPPQVVRLSKKLRKLKLDYNDHLRIDSMPEDLSALRVLSLRGCKLPSLPNDINNLRRCSWLQFNENVVEKLPDSFSKLRSLTNLDMSNNRLYNLPSGFDSLQQLKTLYLEGNNLEEVSPMIAKISTLQILDVCKNRIRVVPDVLCDLGMLKRLNVERNKILVLPDRIKHLGLVDFRVGHNNLQHLSNDLFSHRLGLTIKKFSVCENNLLELPSSLCEIDPESLLEADFNPLLSPPQHLLSEGLKTVQTYLYVRSRRLEELTDLLSDEDFDFNPDSATPLAADVLEDGTGFLQPVDLAEFDAATHEYVNGEFYKCPASGLEIVQRAVDLREFRETEIYLIILAAMNSVLGKIWKDKKQRKVYTDAVLLKQTRPWGVRREPMSVWVLSLNTLLKDTPKNKLVKKPRPSVYSLIEAALPPMPFPFSLDLLKDALRLYVSPYGQVADTESVTFPECDCIGGPKNKPLRHDPCTKASVVLCLSVYEEEEAERRSREYDEFCQSFSDIEEDVKLWLLTEQGRVAWEKEIARRKAVLRDDLELREDLAVAEIMKMRKATKQLESVQERKRLFDEDADFALHNFENIAEAVEAVTAAEEEVAKIKVREVALTTQIENYRSALAASYEVRKHRCKEDLLEKYCVLYYRKKVKSYRIYACYKSLRRPWDGEDGADYALWVRKLGDKYRKDKLNLPDTSNIEEYIANEEKEDDERRKRELFHKAKSGDGVFYLSLLLLRYFPLIILSTPTAQNLPSLIGAILTTWPLILIATTRHGGKAKAS